MDFQQLLEISILFLIFSYSCLICECHLKPLKMGPNFWSHKFFRKYSSPVMQDGWDLKSCPHFVNILRIWKQVIAGPEKKIGWFSLSTEHLSPSASNLYPNCSYVRQSGTAPVGWLETPLSLIKHVLVYRNHF